MVTRGFRLFVCLFLKRSYAKGKKRKRKEKSNQMVVFPKQICKNFLPETGVSRSTKTFLLNTDMELEVWVCSDQ